MALDSGKCLWAQGSPLGGVISFCTSAFDASDIRKVRQATGWFELRNKVGKPIAIVEKNRRGRRLPEYIISSHSREELFPNDAASCRKARPKRLDQSNNDVIAIDGESSPARPAAGAINSRGDLGLRIHDC